MISLMKFLGVGIVSLSMFLQQGNQAPPFDKIGQAIEKGNATALSAYFDKNVELTLPENEGIFSKTQASQLMKDFFARNKPVEFKLMHKGGSEKSAMYGIGELRSEKGKFRVYIFLKKSEGAFKIQQLKVSHDK